MTRSDVDALSDPADAILAAADRVSSDIATRADEHDRRGDFAAENVAALWDAGLGNLTLSVRSGGNGADLWTVSRALALIGAGDASTALVWVMHLIHLRLLEEPRSGLSNVMRERVAPSSLAGPALITALRVEPELGTPARGGVPATVARRGTDPDGEPAWLLSGRKIYCTGSYGLRWMLVWAALEQTDEFAPFLVDATVPGIEIVETWDHLGMRASASHDVIFRDTPVALDAVGAIETAGSTSAGLRHPLVVGSMNLMLMSLYLGVATAARDWLIAYLHERTPANLGAPLSTLPRMQSAVGELELRLTRSRTLLRALAERLDAGGEEAVRAGREAALVKAAVSRDVIAGCEQAVGLIGNPGLTMHHPLQRHYRDALCARVNFPQEDVVLLAAGRAALEEADGGR
jgi:alkylation response protein AidB-like acyl-CoA dehydrogenase